MRDGVLQTYWTIRYRRDGVAWEHKLGWFASRRAAEIAFGRAVEKLRTTPLEGGGADPLIAVIDRYVEHVAGSNARPNRA